MRPNFGSQTASPHFVACPAVTQQRPWISIWWIPATYLAGRAVGRARDSVDSPGDRLPTRITRRTVSGSGSARLGLSQKGNLPSPRRGTEHLVGPRSPTRAILQNRLGFDGPLRRGGNELGEDPYPAGKPTGPLRRRPRRDSAEPVDSMCWTEATHLARWA
jgi:hypothetical protein